MMAIYAESLYDTSLEDEFNARSPGLQPKMFSDITPVLRVFRLASFL